MRAVSSRIVAASTSKVRPPRSVGPLATPPHGEIGFARQKEHARENMSGDYLHALAGTYGIDVEPELAAIMPTDAGADEQQD